MTWEETKATLLTSNSDYDEFNYALTDTQLYMAITMLPIPELVKALKEVRGCGCGVDSLAGNVRQEIFDRVYSVLDAYEDLCQDRYSPDPGDY